MKFDNENKFFFPVFYSAGIIKKASKYVGNIFKNLTLELKEFIVQTVWDILLTFSSLLSQYGYIALMPCLLILVKNLFTPGKRAQVECLPRPKV